MSPLVSFSALMFAACGTGDIEAESEAAGLSIAYVSGHLGSEAACPILTSSLERAVCDAPCEPSPCDNGAVLVRVKNIVDHAVPVKLERIELLLEGRGELQVREIATTDGRRLSEIGADETVTLRVLFPRQEIHNGQNAGSLRLIFSGEEGEKLEIVTPELVLLPIIVT